MNRQGNPFPPGMPPGVGGALPIGGAPQQSAAMQAAMVPRAYLQKGIYQAASMLSTAKAQILQVASIMTELREQASQTVKIVSDGDGLVQVGGMHVSPQTFAERFGLATADDLAILDDLLEDVRAAAGTVPVEEAEEAALLGKGDDDAG